MDRDIHCTGHFPGLERCGQRLVLKLTVKNLEFLSVVVKPNKGVPEAKVEREQCSLDLTLNL